MGLFSRFKKKKKEREVGNTENQIKTEITFEDNAKIDELVQVQNATYVALAGVQELNSIFEKELPRNGKFEALLFNSVIVFQAYELKYPGSFSFLEFKEEYVDIIKEYGPTYNVKNSDDVLIAFINHRFDFFTDELSKIYGNDIYTPGTVYTAFYETPFEIMLEPYSDLSELLKFKVALTQVITFVQTNLAKLEL